MRQSLRRLLFLSLSGVLATAAAGQVSEYNFTLSGAQEVPPNNSNAAGSAQLLFDASTQRFDLDLQVFGIDLDDLRNVGPNGTPVHIHMAPAGSNGPIVVDVGFMASFMQDGLGIRLSIEDELFGGQQGNVFSNPDDNEAALFAGNMYVNIHTNDFAGGQIRGQIVPEPTTLAMLVLAALPVIRRR